MSGRPRLDRIAIVMMSAIGDAVHVLPVINALKRHSPASRITWFLAPGPASLVRGHPAVDEIIEFRARGGWRAWRDMRRLLRNRRFDLVIDLQVALKAGLLTALIDAPVKLGFDRRRARDLNWLFTTHKIQPRENQHVQDQYFEFLDWLGVPHDRVDWGLGPWPHESHPIPERRPYAAVAVSSNIADRNWPFERWAEVIDVLQERYGLHSVLVGGRSPSEVTAERVIMERARHTPTSTLGNTLREMVAVLAGADLVMSPDTSVQHIATALGRPVVSLIATLDPKRTGPYGPSQQLVVNGFREPGDPPGIMMTRRPGRIDRVTVPQVLEKVELWASQR